MHVRSEPAILYFGTPVVLISTVNEDGSYNLAPMSSAFWLGWRCMLGLAASSKTPQNLKRTGECVLNLPSVDNVAAVDRLARTTGSNPVPEGKLRRGYRFERDKFDISELTPVPSETVAAPRVLQCPVQLEAKLVAVHGMAADDPAQRGQRDAIEVRILRVHLDPTIVMEGDPDRVDPDKWRPLIMSFQHFYGLEPRRRQPSTLAEIPERLYRGPDIDRARSEVSRRRCG
ncbi:MAG TPA: flavin reductase family protein [Stellaceae bacterium]|nr:flavin reductase family protein [Stellaceae bacterium]